MVGDRRMENCWAVFKRDEYTCRKEADVCGEALTKKK
jgi:hypothetical protein